MNNTNSQDTQKRVLLATVLSFAFFIAYDILYLQPQQNALQSLDQNKSVNISNAVAPDVSKISNVTAPTATAPTVQNQAPTDKKAISNTKIVSTIKTLKNIIEIDEFGRIAQVTMQESKYIKDGDKLHLFEENQLRPLEVRFKDTILNQKAFKIKIKASANSLDATKSKQKLVLTQDLDGMILTKTLVFYPDGHYDIEVKTSTKQDFFITTGFRPNVLVDMYADHGSLLKLTDDTINLVKDGDCDITSTVTGVKFASAFDRYYTTLLYNFDHTLIVSLMPDSTKSPQIFIHANTSIKLGGYIGPKEHKILKALNPELTDTIEYGWFTFIAKPMFLFLQFIHSIVGNWGWAIVILTILIKLILYPLSLKGMKSMNRLKELAPKVKELQERYKGDSQKASMHMMELYKKHDANPMGGCLPMVLQIPVFFAIYRVLLNAIELKGSAWMLWINDLAEMDPYFILPILMGITMYLQQLITPNTMQDDMQKKIFQFLPVIFTFFFLWFPAGLTLYWFVNNLFTITQQYYVNQLFLKEKDERHKQHQIKKGNKNDI